MLSIRKSVGCVSQIARLADALHHVSYDHGLSSSSNGQVLSAALCRLLHSTNPVAMSDSPSSRATPIPEGILLGLGNPLLDIRVRADKSFLDKYNLKPDNSILAEDRHDVMFQEMVQKYKAEFLPGGATQNTIRVAQWLLQSPRATSFIGAVGDDEYGKILKRISQEVGVNVLYEVIEGAKSGLCGAVITDQRRSLVTKLGAAKLLDLDFVRRPEVWKHVEKARYYYVGGYVLPVCPEAIKNILHHASVNDKQVVMNLHATYLCGDFLRKDLNLMHYIDVLFGNGPEARKFAELAGFGTQDVREIALKVSGLPKANAKRGRVVVFTQGGSKSMFVAHNGEVTEYPIQPVDPALIKDTNACGDAFAGGFISQYIQGKSLDECMRCSIYAARVIVQNYGCSFPEKPEFK